MARTHDVVVVGGGNAGISLTAKLLRDGVEDVVLVEPEPTHRYRPLLNYVGGGLASMTSLERPAAAVVPSGCTWVRDRVVAVEPDVPAVVLAGGDRIEARRLVVCPGLEEDWDATPGLLDAQAAGWAGSTFVVGTAPRVWPALRGLRRGRVLFTVPPEPAPCGATAFKPLFLACDHWRRTGVLGDLEVTVVLPGDSPLGLPRADDVLERTLDSFGVRVLRRARVRSLEARHVVVDAVDGEHRIDDVAFAHVVPHYRAPRWVVEGGLADGSAAGLVDVDPRTLRHARHDAVWSLGDVAGHRTRSSGGALREQVAVLAHNLTHDPADAEHYDGYTVMPITVDRRRLMLVEVDREGRPTPSLPFVDLVRPRRATFLADRYGLPITYFRRILRGRV